MNRTFALFLAIIILIAHMLAIHKTAVGNLAPPYEMAHVAFRIGRNFVRTGEVVWFEGTPGWESYPSLLWVGVAALAERFHSNVNGVVQLVGASSAVISVVALAQFSRGRLAGVIAPLLFVVSGAIAAAAASGTEATTFALFLVLAFLGFEMRARVLFAVSLTLACLTRPEGVALGAVLLAMELVRSIRSAPPASESGTEPARGSMLGAFLPAILALTGVAAVRMATVGTLTSPWVHTLLEPTPGQWRQGLLYVVDFLGASGGALLLPVPLWYLLRGNISGTGARALALTATWFLLVVLSGGGSLPFFHDMVPVLAILFVAVQEGMTVAIDGRRIGPHVSWILFVFALFMSAMASKYPGDLGPLPTEQLHRAWMHPRAKPPLGYEGILGRLGQAEEIQSTERLRAVGVILRDQLDPEHSILTPWPGAIGYLSRHRVIDALGRTSPAPGVDRTRSWHGRPRVDVVEALRARPDYVLPVIRVGQTVPSREAIAQAWTHELDLWPDDAGRLAEVARELEAYELIVMPAEGESIRQAIFPRNRFFLLRRRALELGPSLHLSQRDGAYTVEVSHDSHYQLVDLRLHAVDREGKTWAVTPSGELVEDLSRVARTSILLYPTGERRIQLMKGALPRDFELLELQAVLRNPYSRGEGDFAAASPQVTAR